MYTLSNFKTTALKFKKLLQQHFYKIQFNGLNSLSTGVTNLEKTDLEVWVQSTKLPSQKLTTQDITKCAITFKMPDHVDYDRTWTCEVLMSLSMEQYKSLMDWQRHYSDLTIDGGGDNSFPDVSATVILCDNLFNETNRKITLYGVFPEEVPEIDLTTEDSQYLKPSVTFGFSYIGGTTDMGFKMDNPIA